MNHSTLIEVKTPFGEGMYHWKKMNLPFQIGSVITCFFKQGQVEIHFNQEKGKKTVYQISHEEWLKGHTFSISEQFKIKFKGKIFDQHWNPGKNLEWNEFEIGKSGFIAATVLLGIGSYIMPKEDHSVKMIEVEEVATIRLTTGESGLVAFKAPEIAAPTANGSEPVANAARLEAPAAPVAPVAVAPARAPEPVSVPVPAPQQKADQAFSSNNGAKNKAGVSIAKAPVPNAAALLLSRRMASLQKGLQKVMGNPEASGVKSTSDSASNSQGTVGNTSSLAKSISGSGAAKGGSAVSGSVYGNLKTGNSTGAGNGSLSGGNNFELNSKAGKSTGSGIQLVQTSALQVSGGKLNAAVIQKTFQKNMGQLRNCYEAANINTATLKINLEFTVTKNGTVIGQKALPRPDRQPASAEQKQLESCILNRMASWKFETGNLDSNVVIEYPLTFRSLTAGDE